MTHPHRWLRAAHKIAPNGAFSRYIVLSGISHGTVKTVPYKPNEGSLLSQKLTITAKFLGGVGSPRPTEQYKSLSRDFTAKQKRGDHCPASFFIKRRRKTERLAVSCNETEPTPLQADALPSDPAGRSGIPLLYRTMGMFFVPVLSFDAYIVHDFCRNCKRLRCTMCCKIYVYFCATCPML